MSLAPLVPLMEEVLTASWQGSLSLLFILLLRPLLGHRVSARWRGILWVLVMIRLLVPGFVLPPSPASLQRVPVMVRPAVLFEPLLGGGSGVLKSEPAGEDGAASSTMNRVTGAASAAGSRFRAWEWAVAIWMLGVVALAMRNGGAMARLHRRLRAESGRGNRGDAAVETVEAIWQACCHRFSLSHAPRLVFTDCVETPALFGMLRPVLLIPTSQRALFSREDWEHLFMHELAHYQRHDHWMQALQLLAQTIHWFNPLVWMGIRWMRADQELAADERALQRLTGDRSVAYGATLLKVLSVASAMSATSASRQVRVEPGMIGIVSDRAQMKDRLQRIVAFGPAKWRGTVVGVGVIFVAAVAVLGREPLEKLVKRLVSTPAQRGQIVDRHGEPLAVDRRDEHGWRREYPHGSLAAHVLGYMQRPHGSQRAGREGLEVTFDNFLAGKPGETLQRLDAQGRVVSEKEARQPIAGKTVVTTLDLELQRLCEKALEEGGKPGAMVVVDPKNGDVLAMASWPSFDPNSFFPVISKENFQALVNDPANPLIGRAYRAAYPVGAMFKVVTALAALQEGVIRGETKIANPPTVEIDGTTLRDWKKEDRGEIDLTEALMQNAETWFYQVGMKTGETAIREMATGLGFAKKTEIPLPGEAEGQLAKVTPPAVSLARLATGAGSTATPLQMALAMATLADNGSRYQARLVKEIRPSDKKNGGEYPPIRLGQLSVRPDALAELRKAMVGVVHGDGGKTGTAGRAIVDGTLVAGKTGAGRLDGKKERFCAWFAGYLPADAPLYAFAIVVESDEALLGGEAAAPLARKVFNEFLKKDRSSK